MARTAVFDVAFGDFKAQFNSLDDVTAYVEQRIIPRLQDAATEAWSLAVPRAFNNDIVGEYAGFWSDSQPFNGRSVDVGVSVSVRF